MWNGQPANAAEHRTRPYRQHLWRDIAKRKEKPWIRRSYARPTTPALRRSRALQRLLLNAICPTHNVSPSLAPFELTGRVRCDIDELTFRIQDGPDMAMVQASHPLGEQYATGQRLATLTVTRAKLVVDRPIKAFEVRWRSYGCSMRLPWPQLSPKIQTHHPWAGEPV